MMTDGIGTTLHTYHPVGVNGALRVATMDGPLAGTSDTARYTYDALGRTHTRNIGSGTTENLVTWDFDALGRLDATTSLLGVFDYSYVAQTERLDRVDFPNGARTQFDYFASGMDHRLKQIKHLAVATNPASIVSKFDYTYDAEGQIATWVRQLGATTTTFALGYDNAGQLSAATLTGTGGTIDRHAYTYDRAGNRRTSQRNMALTQWGANNRNQLTTQNGGGKLRVAGHLNEPAKVTVNGTKATVNAANEYEAFVSVTPGANTLAVTATDYAPTPNTRTNQWSVTITGPAATTFAYDLNGNMTSDGTRTFTWDSENRLKSVTIGASVWSWDYDGMNRRVRERLNGTIQKQWVLCGTERCEERDAANAVIRRLYAEGERVGATSLFYTRDHLGSIRELLDASTTVRARYDYAPYGERTKLVGDLDTDVGFTGHQTHAATGLTLAPFRAYDAVLGRWISPDPIAEAGGVNLYAYCGGDPFGCVDPLGLDWLDWNISPELVNFSAGAGDALSFGITNTLRELAGANGVVDKCSKSYKGGEIAGTALGLATGVGGVAKLAGAADRVLIGQAKSGVYRFTASSGRTYIGQSNNVGRRLTTHLSTGKQPAGSSVTTWEVAGGKLAREKVEQGLINRSGGTGALENIINPLGGRPNISPMSLTAGEFSGLGGLFGAGLGAMKEGCK